MTADTTPRPRRKTRNPRAGGAPRIDWQAAFTYYCADPTFTARDVAETCHVSVNAVRHRMTAERWVARRAELQAAAATNLDQEIVESLEQSNREWLLTIAAARARFRQDLADGKAAVNGRDVAALGRFEQLIRGEATDRVSIAEVNRELGEFVSRVVASLDEHVGALVAKFVANGKRSALVGEFRVGLLPLIEQAAAGLSLGPGVEEPTA